MLNDVVVAGAEVAETDKRDETWAKNLRPGNKNLARIRSAPLHERAAAGLGLQYGATIGEIAHCVLTGIKHGTIELTVGRLLLNKVLPTARPVQLDFPQIRTAADLIEAEERITQALNQALISPDEALKLQAWAKTSFRNRRVAKATMGDE